MKEQTEFLSTINGARLLTPFSVLNAEIGVAYHIPDVDATVYVLHINYWHEGWVPKVPRRS